MSNYNSRHSPRLVDRLLKDGIVLLTKPLDDEVTNYLLAQLLFLMDRNSKQPISLYIDSPGGSMTSCFAIMDTIVESATPVYTSCVGFAAGAALLILACGARGQRRALPHAQVQMTQLSPGRSIEQYGNDARLELKRLEDLTVARFVGYSGQPEQKIRLEVEAETIFDAVEARDYGLIDQIVMV